MRKRFFIAIIIAVCILILSLVYGLKKTPIPHSNPVDTKITLYSDKHITQNAISTNLDFKDIAFNVETPRRLPFSNQIAAVVRSIQSIVAPDKKSETTKEYGSWIWTPVLFMTPEYIESTLAGAKADGVNTMYISIDSYLDIFTMDKGEEREKQKKEYSDRLDYFLGQASLRGIAVDAEAGWRNWAEDGNIYKAFAVVNYVKNFNDTHENKFRGFQYDVEPYLLDSYKENPAPVLKDFIKLVDETESFMGDSVLRFSVVVPDFYDENDQATPKFSYNGSKDYAFGHLLSILDRRPDSSIIIMSYRNFAKGEDGAIEISNNEMQTARGRTSNTKIIIAQETGEFPPLYITFHDTSKRYLLRQIGEINAAFMPYSNFGGIAMHYVNALMELK